MKFLSHHAESRELPCQLLIKEPDVLLAHFPDETFSVLSLDQQGKVFCFCSSHDMLFHIDAQIDKVLGERDLQLIVLGVKAYPQRRRFFRVDADVVLKYWPLEPVGRYANESERMRINLSAVGMRFETPQFLRHVDKLGLELNLGGTFGVVRCIGRVVRVSVIEDRRVEAVAIDFEEITRSEQEKIFRFCLTEQRRQIRLKVQVLDF